MVQPITSSLQLLEQLPPGKRLTADDLDELIASQVPEDLHLDYKDGRLLDDLKSARQTVREYVSAFANSAGGVLIIGVEEKEEKPVKVTGCKRIGRQSLASWATSCISDMANSLYPTPNIHVVRHRDGEVLVCAVYRSLNLIPIVEGRKSVYYLRFNDQTRRIDDYLMADLLLGRRHQPALEIVEATFINMKNEGTPRPDFRVLRFELRLRLENTNFVWAEDSTWGLVSFLADKDYMGSGYASIEVSQSLQTMVTLLAPDGFDGKIPRLLVHYTDKAPIEKPFAVAPRSVHVSLPLFYQSAFLHYMWKAAVYLVARNSMPIWYQLAFPIDMDVVNAASQGKSLPKDHPGLSCNRAFGQPPIVTWTLLQS